MPKFLSDNFTWVETTASNTAQAHNIDNTEGMTTAVEFACMNTATGMERVRAILGNKSIHINSWYRSSALNLIVGSKPTSQHRKGEAVDFTCAAFGTPLEVCKLLVANRELIKFDQLILEHSWIHISFVIPDVVPRNQVLSLLESGGYATGLTTQKGIAYV